jgi:predicted metalloendopeptidase
VRKAVPVDRKRRFSDDPCEDFVLSRRTVSLLGVSMAAVALLTGAGAAPAADTIQASPTSGLFPRNVDPRIRPQDDLYGHVNGAWLATAEIPPEHVTHGAFTEIAAKVDADIRALIESDSDDFPDARKVRDLYASIMDEPRLAALGYDPIRPQLQRIDALTTPTEFARESGHLSATDIGGPFNGTLAQDSADPTAIVVNLSQSGILLPSREYYLSHDARYVDVRKKYVDYLTLIFSLTGRRDPQGDARAVIELETLLASAQWPEADSRDPVKTANLYTLERLQRELPGFDWQAWAKPQGIDRASYLVLAQPSFFHRFAQLAAKTPLDTWKAWLAARYITAAAPFLSRPFETARFDFFGLELSGQEKPRLRWRRGVSLVSGYLGDAVGRLYVKKYFSATARARVQKITDNVVAAFRQAIRESAWMTAPTKREALDKLSRLKTKIGYPNAWRDYRSLEIKADDLYGNIQRARKYQNDEGVRSVRGENAQYWLITPQTVNAYYNHARNELVVTAAILQPPVFDLEADDAVNYGAIGSMIGHELGHAFDLRGRLTDSRGDIRDWWAPEDAAQFKARTDMLNAQAAQFEPVPGLRVDSELTMVENIGDLVGLSVSFAAYQRSLEGRQVPVIDGFTGAQRFFFGWAQIWRAKTRDEFTRQSLMASAHAPSQFRTNGPVSNVDAFYDAFGLKPTDKLFRPPAERVRIW